MQKMGRKSEKITRKEQEMLDLVKKGKKVTAKEAADEKGISYPAAYSLLESLKERGVIEDQWEKKGNKKYYFAK